MVTKKSGKPQKEQAAQARKKLLDEELARYVRLLKEHGPPEKDLQMAELAFHEGIYNQVCFHSQGILKPAS